MVAGIHCGAAAALHDSGYHRQCRQALLRISVESSYNRDSGLVPCALERNATIALPHAGCRNSELRHCCGCLCFLEICRRLPEGCWRRAPYGQFRFRHMGRPSSSLHSLARRKRAPAPEHRIAAFCSVSHFQPHRSSRLVGFPPEVFVGGCRCELWGDFHCCHAVRNRRRSCCGSVLVCAHRSCFCAGSPPVRQSQKAEGGFAELGRCRSCHFGCRFVCGGGGRLGFACRGRGNDY